MWVDSHVHLDALELNSTGTDGVTRTALGVRQQALGAGVSTCVIPAVHAANFDAVRLLAHQCSTELPGCNDVYALGIHPLYVPQAQDSDLDTLEKALRQHRSDSRLVAVGEIGLDFFVPHLCTPEMRERQWQFYTAQLKLARALDLPVILHVRKSADMLLKGLREIKVKGGIAHAFNGSMQQAMAFVELGFKLGFGGTLTYERAAQIRRLAQHLPTESIVLETDAPDIPPQWLYRSAEQRALGLVQGVNTPDQLPCIAQAMAQITGLTLTQVAQMTSRNCWEGLTPSGDRLLQN
jgi:TatD DNase family protein